MMSSSPHDGTPLLAAQSGPVASHTPSSSIGSSPHSSGSSSSSLTITRASAGRVEQASRDVSLLRPPQIQVDMQGHTPPPAYASLTPNTPSGAWGAPTQAPPPSTQLRPPPPRVPEVPPAPVFDLYSSQTHQFGPTPLARAATVPFAAYIEAPGAPDARAYRRFVSALAVAIGIYVVLSVAVGLEIVGEGGLGWFVGEGWLG